MFEIGVQFASTFIIAISFSVLKGYDLINYNKGSRVIFNECEVISIYSRQIQDHQTLGGE